MTCHARRMAMYYWKKSLKCYVGFDVKYEKNENNFWKKHLLEKNNFCKKVMEKNYIEKIIFLELSV